MSSVEQRFLGEMLARKGAVAPERLELLYGVQREKGGDLIDLLVNANLTDEKTIARILAEEAQLALVDSVDPGAVQTEIATRVPIAFAKNHKIIVVAEGETSVKV